MKWTCYCCCFFFFSFFSLFVFWHVFLMWQDRTVWVKADTLFSECNWRNTRVGTVHRTAGGHMREHGTESRIRSVLPPARDVAVASCYRASFSVIVRRQRGRSQRLPIHVQRVLHTPTWPVLTGWAPSYVHLATRRSIHLIGGGLVVCPFPITQISYGFFSFSPLFKSVPSASISGNWLSIIM